MSNPPFEDDVERERVAAMLRQLGLGPDGRPRVGMPGALLRKPVTSARYEPDLIQAQRAMQDERPQPGRARPTEAKKVEPAYKSTTLPSHVLPDDEARREDERRMGIAPPPALPKKADGYLARERDIYDRLVPDNMFDDAAGKLWALPVTALGIAAGSLNVLAGQVAGHKDARISVGNNALQFEDGLIGQDNSAFTLGNAVLYGPGGHPNTPVRKRYDGVRTPVSLGDHETGHTYQHYRPGFIPRWALGQVRKVLTDQPNPYEVEADDFGDEMYRGRRK